MDIATQQEQLEQLVTGLKLTVAGALDADVVLINPYTEGKISPVDMLAHACQFDTELVYANWLRRQSQGIIKMPGSGISDGLLYENGNII